MNEWLSLPETVENKSVNSRYLLEGIPAFTGSVTDAIIVPRFQDQRVTLLLFSIQQFRHHNYTRFRIDRESPLWNSRRIIVKFCSQKLDFLIFIFLASTLEERRSIKYVT